MSRITKPFLLDETGVEIVNALNDICTVLQSERSGPVEKAVNFYDYDGTLCYAYTAEEAAALTALPANPTHEGLTSQGWNWSLSNIKTYLTNHPDAVLSIGQMYVTTDGKTKMVVDINATRLVFVSYTVSTINIASIDWGDGSTVEYLDGRGGGSISHIYDEEGEYTISIDPGVGSGFELGAPPLYVGGREYFTIKEMYFGPVTYINAETLFSQAGALKYLTMPNTVTYIGTSAFSGCISLQTLIIPKGVTYIDGAAFTMCRCLEHLCLPDTLTKIYYRAFLNCNFIKTLSIPDTVTYIDESAFEDCFALENLTLSNALVDENNAFALGMNVFSYCHRLKSINIPSGITVVPEGIFNECYELEALTLPEGLEAIDAYVFQECFKLKSVNLPSTITYIGDNAFADCFSLSSITINATTPPTLADATTTFFNMGDPFFIFVPSASVQTYKEDTNWSLFASYIYAIGDTPDPYENNLEQ